MESKHFVGKVSLRAIVVKDGKILIDRDVNDADIWELPGGRLDAGESIEDGLKREFFEELGIHIVVGSLRYSEQFHQTRDGTLSLLLTYEASLVDRDAVFTLDPNEVAEVKWIDKSEIGHQKIYQNCLNALNAYWK